MDEALSTTSSEIDTNWCVFQMVIDHPNLNFLYAIRKYVVWLFQPQGLAHHSGLFVCHQDVSGVAISTTSPGLPFWPHCVPSGCKCYCMFMNYLLSNIISLTGCMHLFSISYCNTHLVL